MLIVLLYAENLKNIPNKFEENKMSETESPKSYEQQCSIILENYQVINYIDPNSGRIVKIYEMIHIAPAEFYAARNAELAVDHKNGFVIHHEGIQGNLGKGMKDSYSTIAECLGWDFQKRPEPTPIEVIDVNLKDLNFFERQVFSSTIRTISFILGKVAKSLKEGPFSSSVETFRERFLTLDANTKMPLGLNTILLDKRNRIALKAVLKERKNVSLVWGKAHRRGLEAGLFQAGFQLV